MNNGGYFCFRGNAYHIDQTVLEFLDHVDKPDVRIYLERREDIEIEGRLTQVKHYNQKFYPSKIAKAIKSLYQNYDPNKDSKVCLLCYFPNKIPGIKRYSIEELTVKFKLDESDEEKLKSFSKVFYIEFAEGINEAEKTIMEKVKKVFFCSDDYVFTVIAIINMFLVECIIKHPPGQEEQRFVMVKDILNKLKYTPRGQADTYIEHYYLTGEYPSKEEFAELPSEAQRYITERIGVSISQKENLTQEEEEEIQRNARERFVNKDRRLSVLLGILYLLFPVKEADINLLKKIAKYLSIKEVQLKEMLNNLRDENFITLEEGVYTTNDLDKSKKALRDFLIEENTNIISDLLKFFN